MIRYDTILYDSDSIMVGNGSLLKNLVIVQQK